MKNSQDGYFYRRPKSGRTKIDRNKTYPPSEAIKLVKKHIHINHVIKQGIQLGFVDKKELYDSEGTFIEEIKFKEKEIIPFSDSEEEYILL